MSSSLLKILLIFLEIIYALLPRLIDYLKSSGVKIYEKAKRFTKT